MSKDKGGPPPGMSSGELLHMQQAGKDHGNEHSAGALTGSGGHGAGTGEGFDQHIGGGEAGMMHGIGKSSLLGGELGGHISMPIGDGVFNRNPIKDVADGNFLTPGNINATADLSKGIQGVGDMHLGNATGAKAANIAPGLGADAIQEAKGMGGQGH